MHHQPGNRVHPGRPRISSHLDVLKSVECKSRDVGFAFGISAKTVNISVARVSDILGHRSAIGMQHFTVAELDPCACRPFDFHDHDAGKILAEIKDEHALRRSSDGHRLDLLNSLHWHTWKSL